MSNTVNCPHCSQPMQYMPQLQGQQVLCPHCQQPFMMPPPAQPTAPQAMPVRPAQGQPAQGYPVQGQPVQGYPAQGQAAPMGGLPVGAAVTAVGGGGRSSERRLTRAQMQQLKLPAMFMLVINVIGILLATAGLIMAGNSLATGPTAREEYFYGENWQLQHIIRLVLCLINIGLMWIAIVGAQKMGQGRDYGAAKMAAIISSIPVCGMSICAMPFGIWSLIVLSDTEIQRNFRSSRRRR